MTTWNDNPGTYLAGQEAVDTLDLVAIDMERKWGAGRLRLLIPEDLRTRFDRQRLLTNEAILNGKLEDVRRETRRMITAWKAADQAAESDPAVKRLPEAVWEISLEDGSVAQIVRDSSVAGLQAAQEAISGRKVAVYTLEEVGRLLSRFPSLYQTKAAFPGATVTKIRTSVTDPLDGVRSHG